MKKKRKLLEFLNQAFDKNCTGINDIEGLARRFRYCARQNGNYFTAKSPKLEQFLITNAHKRIEPVVVYRCIKLVRVDFELNNKRISLYLDLETLNKLEL